MITCAKYLWLIPVLPLVAAGISSLLPREQRRVSAALAIGSMVVAFLMSCFAFAGTLQDASRAVFNFRWFDLGETTLRLGFVLDPLTAVMLVMVTFVGLLIFIYSVGYMSHDENFARFFCFLSLFAAAMLAIVVANSLLLLFIGWELVGLASYLLIGFWFEKPSAAAAAKKAFIVTRIGDIGLFVGMLWLYSKTGTLLFYDNGLGCLEQSALAKLITGTTIGGIAVSSAIGVLIFFGAAGKSGQLPLHVWLPDAMEGPTPVSALIHAATMVAAGVFLVARVFPLMNVDGSIALQVVTWVGAITAVFGALIAVAQNDIKRILAYSTISQLGYMMMGLGVGGVSVGMFHLITHAFFKALLFMGAGSVIHGCDGEQDIRKMGALRKWMPITFATYAIGMMALCGVPLFFSGSWSKEAILDAALHWSVSQTPFYLAIFGAFLTAFYMTRQVIYVFFGASNADAPRRHESPSVMTTPLVILAFCAVTLGVIGTPAWPWFESYLAGEPVRFDLSNLSPSFGLMLVSSAVVFYGIGLSYSLFRKRMPSQSCDPLEKLIPGTFNFLRQKFFIDELYGATIVRMNLVMARLSDWLDRVIWAGVVNLVSSLTLLVSTLGRAVDEHVVNNGFNESCETVRDSSWLLSRWQNGQVQRYLRVIGASLCLIVVMLLWGCL